MSNISIKTAINPSLEILLYRKISFILLYIHISYSFIFFIFFCSFLIYISEILFHFIQFLLYFALKSHLGGQNMCLYGWTCWQASSLFHKEEWTKIHFAFKVYYIVHRSLVASRTTIKERSSILMYEQRMQPWVYEMNTLLGIIRQQHPATFAQKMIHKAIDCIYTTSKHTIQLEHRIHSRVSERTERAGVLFCFVILIVPTWWFQERPIIIKRWIDWIFLFIIDFVLNTNRDRNENKMHSVISCSIQRLNWSNSTWYSLWRWIIDWIWMWMKWMKI